MTIADKILRAKSDYDAVYEAGYEKGKSEGGDSEAAYEQGYADGKQDEYDSFWDAFQIRGEKLRTSYEYGFQAWRGSSFKPKYDLVLSGPYNTQAFRQAEGFDLYDMTVGRGVAFDTSGATKLTGTFAQSSVGKIPPLDLGSCIEMTSTFENLRKMTGYTTTELTLNNIREDCTFKNTFNVTEASLTLPLEKITITGKIGQDFDVRLCTKLSKDSIKSIINHLSGTATGKTLTLSKTAVENAFIITEENITEFSISSKQSDGFYNVTFNSYYDQRSVLHFAVPMNIEFHGEYLLDGEVLKSNISRNGVSSLDMRDEIVFEAGDTYPLPLYDALGTLKIKRTDDKNLSATDITAYKLAEYNNEWLELIGHKSNWNIALL